jgi:hypothetical protein
MVVQKHITNNELSTPSFLDGARKEAKEPLAKFNPRDESRLLLPVDVASRHQKSRHSSLSHSLSPPKFHTHSLFYAFKKRWNKC